MSVCPEMSFLTAEPSAAVETKAATDDTLATAAKGPHWRAWQSVIDHKLIEWGRNPAQLAEDELIPPTQAALRRAVEMAMILRDWGFPPPLRVVPNGDGGVVFERWSGSQSEAFEFDQHGEAELVVCVEGIVARREILTGS